MKKFLLGIAAVFALTQAAPAFAADAEKTAPEAKAPKKGKKPAPKKDAEKPADAPAK